jgi:hypothetical protein
VKKIQQYDTTSHCQKHKFWHNISLVIEQILTVENFFLWKKNNKFGTKNYNLLLCNVTVHKLSTGHRASRDGGCGEEGWVGSRAKSVLSLACVSLLAEDHCPSPHFWGGALSPTHPMARLHSHWLVHQHTE